MNHKFLKVLAVSSLALALSACSEEENKTENNDHKCTSDVCKSDGTALLMCNKDTGDVTETPCAFGCDMTANVCKTTADSGTADSGNDKPGDENKCTANVCKNEDTLLACDTSTGKTTETPCAYGCDVTANACKQLDKCTASACKNDKVLSECDLESGLLKDVPCKAGCNSAENKCYECSEDSHCGDGKICESNKCEEAQCTVDVCGEDKASVIPCVNGRIAETQVCEGDTPKCGKGGGADGIDACVAEDWCSASQTDECKERTDGKTVCDSDRNRCDTLACAKADCGEGTVCALGVCVPDEMYAMEARTVCNPESFVDHCREDGDLYSCMKATDTEYKIYTGNCKGRCRAYEDSGEMKSTCIEDLTREEACGDSTTLTGSTCEEWDGQGWETTYICTQSTNNEPIVLVDDMQECSSGYGCMGNSCEW